MTKRVLFILAFLALLAPGLVAQWDETKPSVEGDFVSADLRNNWVALQRALGGQNMVRDSEALIWAAGDSAAPTHYTLSGTGAAVARAGVGLGDTTTKWSTYSIKLTSGAGAAGLVSQTLIGTSGFRTAMRGDKVSVGAYLWCSTASSLRVGIYDGVDTTWSSHVQDEDVIGGDGWAWMKATRTLDSSADRIVLRVEMAQGAIVGYAAMPSVLWGAVPPSGPVPSRTAIWLTGPGTQPGNLETGTALNGVRRAAPRPGIVRVTSLVVGTAPAAQAAIVDLNKNGSTMYATRPQIAASATTGSAAPDGTYANRCLTTGDLLTWDQDQVGSGTVGADQTITTEVLIYVPPQDAYLGVTEIG